MSSDAEDDFEEHSASTDEWEEFRDGDRDFIGLEQLKQLDLRAMPEDARIPVLNDVVAGRRIPRLRDSRAPVHQILGAQVFRVRLR